MSELSLDPAGQGSSLQRLQTITHRIFLCLVGVRCQNHQGTTGGRVCVRGHRHEAATQPTTRNRRWMKMPRRKLQPQPQTLPLMQRPSLGQPRRSFASEQPANVEKTHAEADNHAPWRTTRSARPDKRLSHREAYWLWEDSSDGVACENRAKTAVKTTTLRLPAAVAPFFKHHAVQHHFKRTFALGVLSECRCCGHPGWIGTEWSAAMQANGRQRLLAMDSGTAAVHTGCTTLRGCCCSLVSCGVWQQAQAGRHSAKHRQTTHPLLRLLPASRVHQLLRPRQQNQSFQSFQHQISPLASSWAPEDMVRARGAWSMDGTHPLSLNSS